MKGDIVPDTDSVARLCGGSHIREDGSIAATAFKPRPGEAYLSVNWLEFLPLGGRPTELEAIRQVLSRKRKIGTTARLAVLNVGQACDAVRQNSVNHTVLTVRHEPEAELGRPQDPSHAGIYGVPTDDNTIPELLAAAVIEEHQARQS